MDYQLLRSGSVFLELYNNAGKRLLRSVPAVQEAGEYREVIPPEAYPQEYIL